MTPRTTAMRTCSAASWLAQACTCRPSTPAAAAIPLLRQAPVSWAYFVVVQLPFAASVGGPMSCQQEFNVLLES